MSAGLPGALLALGLAIAATASAAKIGGEFPFPPESEEVLLRVPEGRTPESALARSVERARQLIDEGQLLLASGLLERAVAEAPDAAELRLSLAQLYARLGRHEDALRIAEALRAADPEAAAPYAVLGGVYLRRGEVEQAVAAYEKLALRAPRDASAHERLGDALHPRDPKAALQRYERALALEPKRVSALARSAVVLAELGRAREAAQRAQHALALREDDSLALLALGNARRAQGQLDAAEQVYRRALSSAPDYSPFTLRLAELLRERGRTGPAIEILEALLERAPDARPAHELLAQLYGESGDAARRELSLGRLALASRERGEAVRHFEAALAANPELDDAALELAALELAEGKIDGAAARLAVLLEAGRASVRAELLQGHVAVSRGDLKGAEAAYRRALESEPADPAAHLALARLLARTRRCGDALKSYAEATLRGAASASVHSERAACHVEHGELALAETAFRSALASDPEHVDALSGLAWVYLRSGRSPDLAGFLSERALALRPDDAHLHYALGRARLAAGRNAEAAEELEAALARQPDHPALLHFLGAARLALGERDEARRRLERVLEVAPGYAQAAAVREMLEQIEAAPGT